MARALTDSLFAIWTVLIEERTGIHYSPGDREILQSKLESRAAERGFDSLLDYYYFIRYDAASAGELDALVDALVVNETYFFRESDPLRTLCDTVLEPMIARGLTPRIWCAACASGEEPLTLAMMLAQRGHLSRVEIVASDIGLRVLARAKEGGGYGARSLRALPPGIQGQYITVAEGRARVSAELYAPIEWRRVNLVDDASVRGLGTFDAILCRNVLIYFSDETVRKVVGSLSEALREEAPLLVGASESLLRFGTLLECHEREGSFFYIKAKHG